MQAVEAHSWDLSAILQTVIAGLLGIVSTAIAAYFKFRELKASAGVINPEVSKHLLTTSLFEFLVSEKKLAREKYALKGETGVGRVLFFRAWNGAQAPQYTTCWEYDRDDGHPSLTFENQPLDLDYQGRTSQIQKSGHALFKREEMPVGSLIRGIYDVEDVGESLWFHLGTTVVDPAGMNAQITYISISKYGDNTFTDEDILKWVSFGNKYRAALEKHDRAMLKA